MRNTNVKRRLLAATVLATVLSALVAGDAYAQAYPRGGRDVIRGTRVLPGATGAQELPTGAEDVPRGETVTTRQRPEVIPLGMRVGTFLLYPKISVTETYDDNIFRVEEDKDHDLITTIGPEFDLRSDWNNHAFNLRGDARIDRFARSEKENVEDYNVDADGRYDITRNIFLFGFLGYSQLSEDRGSPDDAGGVVPTEYNAYRGGVRYFHRLNRVSFRLDAEAQKFDFDDVSRGPLLLPVNNDDRDRLESNVTLRAGYEIVPEYEAFVRATGNNRAYRTAVDDTGVGRDSQGYEIVTGVAIDFTGITFGNLFAGYRKQWYDDDNLSTIEGITGGANITWNVTPLTTFHAGIVRRVEETTAIVAGRRSSGFFATRYSVSADHEVLRNLLLNASVALTENDYKGIDREDRIYDVGVSARYLLNRNFYGSIGYRYTLRDRDATLGDEADYTQNVVTLRVELQM